MKILCCLALALSLALSSSAIAQTANRVFAPAGYAPISSACKVQPDGTCAASVQSTAQTGTFASTSVSASTGTAIFSAGHAKIGPLIPTKGYAIRLRLTGSPGTAFVGTSKDGCVTIAPLTAGGSPMSYTGAVNEIIDAPSDTDTAGYCLDIAPTGPGTYGLLQ